MKTVILLLLIGLVLVGTVLVIWVKARFFKTIWRQYLRVFEEDRARPDIDRQRNFELEVFRAQEAHQRQQSAEMLSFLQEQMRRHYDAKLQLLASLEDPETRLALLNHQLDRLKADEDSLTQGKWPMLEEGSLPDHSKPMLQLVRSSSEPGESKEPKESTRRKA
ncbi:MAG: hypothetical protein GC191_13810 [Azospirillum sp.]|nr:hypothetical protein [Azospirillum sp.]